MVRLWDERGRKIAIRGLGQLPGRRKKSGTTKKLTPRTKPKGKEIEFMSLEKELEEFNLPGGDCG